MTKMAIAKDREKTKKKGKEQKRWSVQGDWVLRIYFALVSGLQIRIRSDQSEKKMQKLNLVKNEDTKHPLSDKEIVEVLSSRGIPIARRTVAKYRIELNILSSNMRKRY